MVYAEKLPPHDPDAEEAVVGSLLIDGSAIDRVASLVRADDFYRERNRWCFEACEALQARGDPIDQISVGRELGLREHLDDVGGPAYLSHLVATVPTTVHVEHFAQIVNRTATMRRLILAAGDIAALGYADSADTEAAMAQAEELLIRVRGTHVVRDFVSLRDVLDDYLEQMGTIGGVLDRGTAPIPSGFADLDRALGGLVRGDLFILAARPAFGKSTLAMNIARHAAGQGHVVAVFSLEMGREQLALRLVAAEAEVDSHLLRLHLIPESAQARVTNAIGALSDLAIFLDDTPAQSVSEMRSKLRRLHASRPVDLVVVDYIQLITGGERRNENRTQELSDVTRQLKAAARELNAPVIAVSQLSRAIEQRPDHIPQLSDLRESGSIEQDADVVAFIHREDKYYNEEQWDRRHAADTDAPYPHHLVKLIIRKNRHGPTREIDLYFRENFSRFEPALATASPSA